MIINKAVGGKHENLDEENKQKEATVLPLLKESIDILSKGKTVTQNLVLH